MAGAGDGASVSAGISAGSAADLLAARIAAISQEVQEAPSSASLPGAGLNRTGADNALSSEAALDASLAAGQLTQSQNQNQITMLDPAPPRLAAPDFELMALTSALKQPQTPAWAIDLFSGSAQEKQRGQRGLASAASLLQSQAAQISEVLQESPLQRTDLQESPLKALSSSKSSYFADIAGEIGGAEDDHASSLFRDLSRTSSPLAEAFRFDAISEEMTQARSRQTTRESVSASGRFSALEIGRPTLLVDSPADILSEDEMGGSGRFDRTSSEFSSSDFLNQSYQHREQNQQGRNHGGAKPHHHSSFLEIGDDDNDNDDAEEDDEANDAPSPGRSGRRTRRTQEPRSFRSVGGKGLTNLREDFNDPKGYGKLNYAYGAAQFLQGAGKDYAENNTGKYLTPEEKETANASLLPGLFTLGGAAIGAATGIPGAAFAGSLLAGGAGSGIESIVGANEQREQSVRETAERLAASLGAAADSVGGFKTQIEATGAPVASLGQGIQALQASGPGVGSAAVAGAGRSALSQGEFYVQDTQETAKFLSGSPALAPVGQRLRTQGELSAGEYRGIAQLALAEGDAPEFNTAMRQASTAALGGDKAYQDAAKTKATIEESPWNRVGNYLGGLLSGHNLGNEAQEAMDARKAALAGQESADGQKYVEEFAGLNKSRQTLIDAGLTTKTLESGFSLAQATGISAGGLRSLMPGIGASLDVASHADEALIKTDTGLMNSLSPTDDPTGGLRAGYQTLINQARADQIGGPLAKAQLARTVFGAEVEESESGFGLGEAVNRRSLSAGLLSGRTYGQLQGTEDALASLQTAQAASLRGFAANPINSPAERNKMLADATGIDQSAEQERYGFKMAGYAQNLAGIDLGGAEAAFGVTQAQISGGPQDLFNARGKELEEYRAKIAELSSELQRGGLTVDDRIAKERQLTDTRQQSAQADFRRNEGAMNDTFALDSTRESTAEIGLGRRIARGGNSGAGDQALAFSSTEIADAKSHLDFDQKHYGGNKQLLADDENRVARTQESREGLLDRTNEYHPSGAFARKLMNDKADFQIAMESPFRDGSPENNPLTRNNAVLGDLHLDMSGLDKNKSERVKAGTWRDEDETRYTQQKNSDRLEIAGIEAERRTAFANLLPMMIAGSPGQGNLSGILPTKGQSAFYNANPFISGSFGPPDLAMTHDASTQTPQAGGQVGAFLASTGADAHFAAAGLGGSGIGGHVGEAILSELRRLNGNVERANAIGGRSAAVAGNPAGYSQNANQQNNPYKVGGGF